MAPAHAGAPFTSSNKSANYLCVNTWRPGQEDISYHLGGKTRTRDRFELGEWTEGIAGGPVLMHAAVSFECEFTNAVDEATQRILVGRVVDIRQNAKQATLLYRMRRHLSG
ncbi:MULTISPECIES: flavin reductase family protein [unclassified Rhizobium]|nr:flavin reductase [Rhizobium sp. 16-488-2b]MBO9176969.1 flavin reductase [Rhizobium sp. 16-488-2a]